MQFHGTGNAPAIFLRNGGIVAFCGVDVFVSENVGYNVNITRFVIQSRAVRTAKFVRRDFLQRRYRFAVFFYQKLNGAYIDSLVLHGKEQGVFVFRNFRIVFLCGDIFF